MSERKGETRIAAHSTESVRRIAERELSRNRSAWLVEALLDQVSSTASSEREHVLRGIGEVEGADVLVAPLMTALRSQDDASRRNAARSMLAALAGPGGVAEERALSALARALQDEDGDTRVLAATALGESANRAATRSLADALGDPEPNVSAALAEALGQIGDARAVDALGDAATTGPRWVRLAAVVALARIGDERATPALLEALQDPLLAEPALDGLGAIGDLGTVESLRGAARSSDNRLARGAWLACATILTRERQATPPDWLRTAVAARTESLREELLSDRSEEAARLLGLAGDAESAEALVQHGGDPDIGAACLAALRLLPPGVAVDAVLDHLPAASRQDRSSLLSALPGLNSRAAARRVADHLADEDEATRYAAGDVLARTDPAISEPLLRDALGHPDARAAAARSLGRMPSPPCQTLADLLEDADANVRGAAADALACCPAREVRERIAAALERESDPVVRVALLGALGAAGGEAAVRTLAPRVRKGEGGERFAAVHALGETGAEAAYAPLVEALSDPAPEIQAAAMRALGRLGDARAASPLAEGMEHDNDVDLRRTAAAALQRIAPPEARARLLDALHDDDWEIRLAAVRTLRKMGDEEVADALRRSGDEDPDPLVRREAARGLHDDARRSD